MKVADDKYLYRLETQNENGSVIEYQEIETVEPLRSVGDVHDEIDLENNKQIKRIEEIVFDGDSKEYWYNDDTHTTDTHFVAYMESLELYCNADNPYCETDKLVFEFGDVHIDENKNFFCTSVESNGMNRIYISIDKSLLAYTVYSHETLKEYFKENPVTVWYVLRYPVEIPRIHAKGHILTHNGSTTLDVQPQTMGKVTPIVKGTIGNVDIELDSVPTVTINETQEGNQITDLTFEGVTVVNNAKGDNVKGTKEVSHTRYDFAPFYDGYTTINNTVEGGYVSAKLYGDTMINIAKPYGETELLTATEDGAIVDLLGENTDGVKLADGTLTEGRLYGDSLVNMLESCSYVEAQNGSAVLDGEYVKITSVTKGEVASILIRLNTSTLKASTTYYIKYLHAQGDKISTELINSLLRDAQNGFNYEYGIDYTWDYENQIFTLTPKQDTNCVITYIKQPLSSKVRINNCVYITDDLEKAKSYNIKDGFNGIGSTTNPTITFTTHPFIFGKGGRL